MIKVEEGRNEVMSELGAGLVPVEIDVKDCAVRTRHVWWGTVMPGEDPVTGSAIGCIASHPVSEGVLLAAPEAVVQIEQGHEFGRPGKVKRVQVGGSAVHVGNGEVWLPDA